jgi:hypothetical protein
MLNWCNLRFDGKLQRNLRKFSFADIVELFLLDCSGKELYMEMLSDMMKDVDMIVAVYDVTKSESFGNVSKVGNRQFLG